MGREVEPDCKSDTVFPCMSGRVLTHDTFHPCSSHRMPEGYEVRSEARAIKAIQVG